MNPCEPKGGHVIDNDIRRLFATVAVAAGHDLDMKEFDDRLTLQKGCYILNSWGYGPKFRYDMYIHGPYSTSLADEYYKIGNIDIGGVDIKSDAIDDLKTIFGKGLHYAEAYATLMMIRDNSPNATYDSMVRRAIDLKPDLKDEIVEASVSLLNYGT